MGSNKEDDAQNTISSVYLPGPYLASADLGLLELKHVYVLIDLTI